jgi:drug/metabolite transporter (DMT)-like permease
MRKAIASWSDYHQGIVLAAIGAVLFSSKAIVIKLSFPYGPTAETLLGLRMAFAFPFFLLVLHWFEKKPKPVMGLRDWLQITLLGAIGYYLASYLDFLGLQYITVGLERVILYLNPAIVLLLSALFLGKRITPMQFAAMVLAYIGVVFVYWHDLSVSSDGLLIGTLLVFGSAISYAIYLVLAGEMVERVGSIRLVVYASTASAVCCVIQAVIVDPPAMFNQPIQVYWLTLVNATLCTVIPMTAVMMAIKRLGSNIAAQAGAIGPVATIFLGWFFLGEQITWLQIIGTAIVVAGIWLLVQAGQASSHSIIKKASAKT